ncbi:MAG: tRNA (adenosine(37)-N6)-threonylcarbamoyltransferase complex dimerization subunit type 1 TsaB, partial [Gammaproteobacteria bacterium]
MKTCLALEASTDACLVALQHEGKLYSLLDTTPRMHARRLMPMVETVLKDAGLNRRALTDLAVGMGPGSFTGIRIAVGLVQGLALGLGLPVRPVCSLAATAWPIARQRPEQVVAVVRDARMGEHYVGVFQWQAEKLITLLPPTLSSYDETQNLI